MMNPISRRLWLSLGLTALVAHTALARPPQGDTRALVTTQIDVRGAVRQPLTLTVAELRQFPPQQVGEVPLVCQTGAKVGQLEHLKGVRLRDVLTRADIIAPGHNDVKQMVVIATASDDYRVVFSWSELFNSPLGDGVLVLFEKDGAPLGDDEGRIALISTQDTRTGPRHVKWLRTLEVRRLVD